jgi:hypothetical protein
METLFDFSEALQKLKEGYRVARQGWNGKGMFIQLQKPDENSKMTAPYLYMKTADREDIPCVTIPWLCSQSDMLADDWTVAG